MKETKPFTADEFLTEWSKGRTFSEETRDQSYIDFAEAYHREKMKETLNSILEDMDCTSVEYHHEIVEEYLEELTQEIKGE